MGSRKEEERNEKIIRGLMKLPPNRRCINCNSLGPQYVCTNFWTFVCTTCSGIHREFTHRVKSVSMAKFTSQEVEALQRGGNQRAREIFLKEWDAQRRKLPDNSNVERIREFIKNVYVDKRYDGGRPSDKPPKDMQSSKNQEEENRRASSYHSFSQSPPYEHQYEDRRYGKPPGVLSRKPGSDRGQYEGKPSSFVYSPGRSGGQILFEDRFANEVPGSRVSDYSASSSSDPFRVDVLSPNFQKDNDFGSPPVHPVRDIFGGDVQPQTISKFSETNTKRDMDEFTRRQRNASSGSFGSVDSNSVSLKSVNSGGFVDVGLDCEQSAGPLPSVSASAASQEPFHVPFIQPCATSSSPPADLFAVVTHHQPFTPSMEQKPLPTTSAASIDLFANVIQQQPSTASLEQKPAVSISENGGWATFDLPNHTAPAATPLVKNAPSALMTSSDGLPQGNLDALSSVNNGIQWPSVQNSTTHGPFSLMANQWHGAAYEVQAPIGSTTSQLWNAFDSSNGSVAPASVQNLPPKIEHGEGRQLPASGNHDKNSGTLEDAGKNGLQRPVIEDLVAVPTLPANDVVSGSLFPLPVLPSLGGMPSRAQDRKSTNPFDLPYDSDMGPCSMFLDMGSLQAALPNPPMPASILGGLSTSWFPQNPVPPFMPAVSPGGLAYVGGQVPNSQLPNMPSQGPVASLGGNPFA